MSDLFRNHIVCFVMTWLIISEKQVSCYDIGIIACGWKLMCLKILCHKIVNLKMDLQKDMYKLGNNRKQYQNLV